MGLWANSITNYHACGSVDSNGYLKGGTSLSVKSSDLTGVINYIDFDYTKSGSSYLMRPKTVMGAPGLSAIFVDSGGVYTPRGALYEVQNSYLMNYYSNGEIVLNLGDISLDRSEFSSNVLGFNRFNLRISAYDRGKTSEFSSSDPSQAAIFLNKVYFRRTGKNAGL